MFFPPPPRREPDPPPPAPDLPKEEPAPPEPPPEAEVDVEVGLGAPAPVAPDSSPEHSDNAPDNRRFTEYVKDPEATKDEDMRDGFRAALGFFGGGLAAV